MPNHYSNRPCYGSHDERLLEFLTGGEEDTFIAEVLGAMESLKPELKDVLDLWMNDEVMMTFTTSAGEFLFTRNIWGFAFIMSKENQPVIEIIDNLLAKSPNFEKVEVNDLDYSI